MLGQNMMAWDDKRLRQATTHLQIPFGVISVIVIGDFSQLPPVGDRPLFVPDGTGSHGHIIYNLFTKVVILKDVIRQSGASTESKMFREILMRLCNGQSSENYLRTLLQRTPTAANNCNEFTDATRLFYKKEDVIYYKTRNTSTGRRIYTYTHHVGSTSVLLGHLAVN